MSMMAHQHPTLANQEPRLFQQRHMHSLEKELHNQSIRGHPHNRRCKVRGLRTIDAAFGEKEGGAGVGQGQQLRTTAMEERVPQYTAILGHKLGNLANCLLNNAMMAHKIIPFVGGLCS